MLTGAARVAHLRAARAFRLSLEEVLAKRVRRATTTRRGARPARVLVIEPEPDARRLLELHLRSWGPGLEAQTVSNGFEALLRMDGEYQRRVAD